MSLRLCSISAFSCLVLGVGLLAVGGAHAQSLKPIGSTVAVVNLVTAEFNRDTRSLAVGDKVNQDEIIEVGLDASGEIKLDDETKLALGPGAKLTLDKFIYDPDKANGSILLNLTKGTFRFITGVAAKPTYVIRTPVASITVRGTIFDLFIQDDGLVWVLLHEGAIQVCNDRGRCRDLAEPGKLLRILPNGDVGSPVRYASLPDRDSVPFEKAFPFVVKTPTIDPNPIFTEDVIKLGALPPPTKPPRGSDPDKPSKKTERPKPTKEATPQKPKRTKTAKTSKPAYEENIVTGMDIVIGFGGGMGPGKMKGPRRPGGGGDKIPNRMPKYPTRPN